MTFPLFIVISRSPEISPFAVVSIFKELRGTPIVLAKLFINLSRIVWLSKTLLNWYRMSRFVEY